MSIIRNIKHRIEYLCFLVVSKVFGLLPIEVASTFSGKGWRLIAPLTSRHSRAIANLGRAFPDKSRDECDSIARDMWEFLGRTFGEFFHLDEIFNSDRIDASAIEAGIAAFGADRRAVVCAAHQGNWEIAVMGPVQLGFRPTGIYQRIKNPLVDRKVHDLRAPYYPGGLLQKSAVSGARALRNIKQGGCLALLADQRDGFGLKVPFFGRPAPSTPFPAHAARLLNVPLIAFFIERQPGVRFKLTFEVVDVPRTENREADIQIATANLHKALEGSIRRRPEQWMWAHRRWG